MEGRGGVPFADLIKAMPAAKREHYAKGESERRAVAS